MKIINDANVDETDKRPQSTLYVVWQDSLKLTSWYQQIKSIKFKFAEYEVFNVMAPSEILKRKERDFLKTTSHES